ncbi:unnamed protein product [Lactuca saligna]|uniref:Uncharacterized protein n=1 Tax=Lactuca saligna TaxID=75948 RepID=A0AA35YN32_LACSI|nr:unnamed protein product [Lactuca saligna]
MPRVFSWLLEHAQVYMVLVLVNVSSYTKIAIKIEISYKVVKARSGVGHIVGLIEDGLSFSFGWNKHGQLGTESTKNEFELSPVRCLIMDEKDVSCGADFTVWLPSIKGASIL